jgi:hypothetical protein
MKTAVEWFNQQLVDRQNGNGDSRSRDEIFQQAKVMELQQRQEDTNYGYSQGWDDGNQKKEPMKPELKQQEPNISEWNGPYAF